MTEKIKQWFESELYDRLEESAKTDPRLIHGSGLPPHQPILEPEFDIVRSHIGPNGETVIDEARLTGISIVGFSAETTDGCVMRGPKP